MWGYITAVLWPPVALFLGFKLRRMDDPRGTKVLIVAAAVRRRDHQHPRRLIVRLGADRTGLAVWMSSIRRSPRPRHRRPVRARHRPSRLARHLLPPGSLYRRHLRGLAHLHLRVPLSSPRQAHPRSPTPPRSALLTSARRFSPNRCSSPAPKAGASSRSQTSKPSSPRGKKPEHVLHAILTIFTCLIWGIVWAVIAINGGIEREMIAVDEYGTSTASSSPPARRDTRVDGRARRLAGLHLTHRHALGLGLVVLGLRVVSPTTPAGPAPARRLRLPGLSSPALDRSPLSLLRNRSSPGLSLRGELRRSLAANPMGILLLPAVRLAAAAHGVRPGGVAPCDSSIAEVDWRTLACALCVGADEASSRLLSSIDGAQAHVSEDATSSRIDGSCRGRAGCDATRRTRTRELGSGLSSNSEPRLLGSFDVRHPQPSISV